MRIVCWQTILIFYHTLFFIFEKAAKFEIVGHALRINTDHVQYNLENSNANFSKYSLIGKNWKTLDSDKRTNFFNYLNNCL